MIVATAGHVDHGKTSLVRALTGVDTDRLAEERARGMSIDLGFAYADLGAGGAPVGFVDVPGHERFVRNMLAGVSAIDFVLLVVAADDGPMPQTFEHLAILELLGVSRGAVALTKVDRVSEARVAQARAEIAAALAHSPLRDAPVLPVVPVTGEGVPELRALLVRAQRETVERQAFGLFRMAVDRSFDVDGIGLVVTGAVLAGSARVGDALMVSPAGVEVRVRGIRAHDLGVDVAAAGRRCALNLAGAQLRRVEPRRGDWLVAPDAHAPTDRLDAELRLLASEPSALRDGARVGLHLGAGALGARVAVLGAREIAPGETGLVQLSLDRPVVAVRGDRIVLRDQAARRTIGGGVVADPIGATRGRARPSRLAELRALLSAEHATALRGLLDASPDGIRLDRFERACNLAPQEARRLREEAGLAMVADGDAVIAVDALRWDALKSGLAQWVAGHHARHPDILGVAEARLAEADPSVSRVLGRAAVRALVAEGALVRDGLALRLPGHRPVLALQDAALLARLESILEDAGLRPPIVGDLARALDLELAALVERLQRLAAAGHLVQVAPNRWFLPRTVLELAQVARELADASQDGSFDAKSYRDRSGIGRNLTIEVLEFLDRIGVTRFARDRRRIAGWPQESARADQRTGQ